MWWVNPSRTSSCVRLFIYRIIYSYTLGRGGDESNILFDQNDHTHKLFKIERGGEVDLLYIIFME